eukprot:CAMPEP_0173390044 /NCGR_PEP_ID=MMETSP1356-20130122/14264_1 /TAXON_ID=77927 ORGANISM="Hemiselmis virescens, Strain PCC157" /NCGR_SAMPLE_ID=MMETSP1356 /ASSEMBLY_ACC=CAM_ASM_000847 /LENGTH=179 /DNA_ID=CAMNT_0014347357 /DNA_START=386 /DNA_END=924 /DNA_ORIENTATION=+
MFDPGKGSTALPPCALGVGKNALQPAEAHDIPKATADSSPSQAAAGQGGAKFDHSHGAFGATLRNQRVRRLGETPQTQPQHALQRARVDAFTHALAAQSRFPGHPPPAAARDTLTDSLTPPIHTGEGGLYGATPVAYGEANMSGQASGGSSQEEAATQQRGAGGGGGGEDRERMTPCGG